MNGEIFELTNKSLCFTLLGSKRNTINTSTKPLVKPNRTPKNLSKPEAPDHLTRLLINLIKKPPAMRQTIKISM